MLLIMYHLDSSFTKQVFDSSIPTTWCLLQPFQCLSKLVSFCLFHPYMYPVGCSRYILVQLTMLTNTLDVELVHAPVFLCCQSQNHQGSVPSCNRGENIFVIYSLLQSIAFGHRPGLTLFNFTDFIQYTFEDSLRTNLIGV